LTLKISGLVAPPGQTLSRIHLAAREPTQLLIYRARFRSLQKETT